MNLHYVARFARTVLEAVITAEHGKRTERNITSSKNCVSLRVFSGSTPARLVSVATTAAKAICLSCYCVGLKNRLT